MPAIVRAFCMF